MAHGTKLLQLDKGRHVNPSNEITELTTKEQN